MKRILLAATAAFAFAAAQPAIAADAPVYKGPPPAAAALFNWSGLYIGGSAGWAEQNLDWAFNPAIPAAVNQAFSLSQSVGVWGLHAGIQGQWAQWVLGVELAYSGFGNSFASHVGYGVDAGSFAEARVRDVWTVGPRVGWASNTWLLYVTGGYANGRIDTRLRVIATGLVIPAFDTAERHHGWFAGIGAEWAVFQNLILGVEYQHIDLTTVNHCPAFACPNPADTNRHDMKAKVDLIRARLSWLFHM